MPWPLRKAIQNQPRRQSSYLAARLGSISMNVGFTAKRGLRIDSITPSLENGVVGNFGVELAANCG
jgi:hypothetical protein